jgi:tRNA threonylcarbamoyladenosine biosynthesis protein TsaB
MRILAIDSSCSSASCAIMNENKLEAEIFLNHKLQHSVILFPMIERLLKMVEITIEDIDGVAVSGGPGSFTGLRIGVSTAKGIAQGGEKKFVAISGLDAMAFQQVGFEGIICPIMDALRSDVYNAFYKWDNTELIKVSDYRAIHIDEVIEELILRNERVMFCGDAVTIHKEHLIQSLKEKACFAHDTSSMPRASSIAELALKKFNIGLEDNIYTYAPIYLRKPQAEREYEKKHGEGSLEV